MTKNVNTIANVYFDRFDSQKVTILDQIPENLALIVVIPCHNEPFLTKSLQSLRDANVPEDCVVEIITVINHVIKADKNIVNQNEKTFLEAERFATENNTKNIQFHTIKAFEMPPKKAGVGLARKIGMDEALHRFSKINKDGIIVCFDADSLCETNYFEAIISHFKNHPKTPGCSIHFEHPIQGNECCEAEYKAIILYELHLRYYKNALQFTGLPFVFYTIGSSMAVRASAYAKQGGMNKRKAGEDFYFLNKIIQLGNFTELNTTKVIPSPRISDRVPFGTGKAVGEIIEEKKIELTTYDFNIFYDLKAFVEQVKTFGNSSNYDDFPLSIQKFIPKEVFLSKIAEISENSTSKDGFITRFFKVFDAFWVLKYVHFARDDFYPKVPVLEASNDLLLEIGAIKKELKPEQETLKLFREIDEKRHLFSD